VSYGGEVALEHVSGRLERGASLALVGPNGAGKSTLIKAILGLLPALAGSVTVLGGAPADARGRIAYVPQQASLDPEFPVSAGQVVLMGRYRQVGWLRRPSRTDRAAAVDALDRVGMAARGQDRFGTLSGGQRQRVLFARALAQGAQLLLLDEPFNGVDLTTQQVLLRTLSELRADGVAVVLSTHDLDVALHACTDACLLNRRQFAFGPVAEALHADSLLAAFAGHALLEQGDVVALHTH